MDAASAFSVPDGPPDGLIVLLPARSGGWRWWRVEQGGLGRERSFMPDAETAPWGRLAEGNVVTALVPAARAPVRVTMPDMPPHRRRRRQTGGRSAGDRFRAPPCRRRSAGAACCA
jgi:general secretion pathway protein L